jgi:hypothetical protein
MEKFAARYCCDNPGAFCSADGAYLLAFALIMLNTDAHNPHADRNLGPDDFVNMCHAPARAPRTWAGLAVTLPYTARTAHNSHAERNLGPDDSVNMCQAPARSCGHPALPYGSFTPHSTLSCSRRMQPGDPVFNALRTPGAAARVKAAAAAAAHACPQGRRRGGAPQRPRWRVGSVGRALTKGVPGG